MPAVTICIPMKQGLDAAVIIDDQTKIRISTETASCLCGAPKAISYDRHKGYFFVQIDINEATDNYVSKVFGKPYPQLDIKAMIDSFPKF